MARSPSTSPARSQKVPPPPRDERRSKKRNSHQKGYSLPGDRSSREKSPRRKSETIVRKSEVTILLCIYNSMKHNWKTTPITFNPERTNDRRLWTNIKDTFEMDLRGPFERWLGFRHVTSIVPIAVCFLFLPFS